MKKETKFDSVETFPQEGGEDHEMVVLDPDVVVLRVDDFHHTVREDLVG